MSSWNFPATAKALVRYFGERRQSDRDRWADGMAAAQAWLAVLNAESTVSASELIQVDELMLAGIGETGTAWEELRLAYEAWREGAR